MYLLLKINKMLRCESMNSFFLPPYSCNKSHLLARGYQLVHTTFQVVLMVKLKVLIEAVVCFEPIRDMTMSSLFLKFEQWL